MFYRALQSSKVFLISISILIDSFISQYSSFFPGFLCLSQYSNLNYTLANIPGYLQTINAEFTMYTFLLMDF